MTGTEKGAIAITTAIEIDRRAISGTTTTAEIVGIGIPVAGVVAVATRMTNETDATSTIGTKGRNVIAAAIAKISEIMKGIVTTGGLRLAIGSGNPAMIKLREDRDRGANLRS